MTWEVLCKCSGKYIDIYFNLKITYCHCNSFVYQVYFSFFFFFFFFF